MDRKRKEPDNPSNADVRSSRRAGYNWRVGLAPSIRVLNRAMIAEAIQRNPDYATIHAPHILESASQVERDSFNEANNEYDYLRSISEFIRALPYSERDLQERDRMLRQLDTKFGQSNLPASLEERKGKKPVPQGSTNLPTVSSLLPSYPIRNLLERHIEVTHRLQRLLSFFLQKLVVAHNKEGVSVAQPVINSNNPMAGTPIKTCPVSWQEKLNILHKKLSCADLESGLAMLEALLKILLKELEHAERKGILQTLSVQDDFSRYLQTHSLENWYEAKISELIKTFTLCMNQDLEKLSQEKLRLYQQWLWSFEPGKSYLNKENHGQMPNPGRDARSRLANLISLLGYSQQSQYFNLRPASTPVGLSSHKGHTSPGYQVSSQMGQPNFNENLAFFEKFLLSEGTSTLDHEDTSQNYERIYNEYLELNQQAPMEAEQQPQTGILSDGNHGIILPPQSNPQQQEPSIFPPHQDVGILPQQQPGILPPHQQTGPSEESGEEDVAKGQ